MGAFLVNLSIGSTYTLALGIAVGNTLAPMLAMWSLRRSGFSSRFTHSRDIPLFCLMAFASMLVSALCGTSMLLLAGVISWAELIYAFKSWWLGDSVGVLLAAPFLLTFSRASADEFLQHRKELLLWGVVTAALCWAVFFSTVGDSTLPLAFLLAPLVVWAALRLGVTAASLAVLLLSFFAAWATSLGQGPFSQFEHRGLLLLWAFMATLVLIGLMIIALLAARKQAEGRASLLLESVSSGVWGLDTNGNTTFINSSGARMLGYAPAELLGQPMHARVHHSYPDGTHYPRELCPMYATFVDGQAKTVKNEVLWRKDGSNFPVEYATYPIYDDNLLVGSVVVFQDITERQASENAMRVAAIAFETHEAIMITDAGSQIIRVNQAFQEVTGYRMDEVLGKNPRILSSGRQSKRFYSDMWQQLLDVGTWSGEIWDRRKDGDIYPKWMTITAVKDDSGRTTEYVAIFNDISARKKAEEEIRHLAFYDALTRLPNRRLLMDRVSAAIATSVRSHYYSAVLFLDMDRFKTLNDTLGHNFGDLLLMEVAERIQSCVREVDTVARLGGDEFVVLIEEIDKVAELASQKVALIAEKIRSALAEPYQLKDKRYHTTPSIGVSLFRGNEESVDDLLKHADMAMYQAKESGRNAVRFFDPTVQQAVEARTALETDLRHAVEARQLHLYYQVQVDGDQRPIGAEALVRWIHPARGLVSPAQFIPIAEDGSLILDIGDWVLETACKQLQIWAASEHTRHLTVAVNVSAKQFKQQDFVEKVADVLRRCDVDASQLKLELTESVVLNDVTDVIAKMHALKALGVRLSLDDFGTGYSSLSYLKQLPLDQIKIDQSFVRDIATDPNDAVMVQTIIDMAQNFRLNVIAEGVETESQLEFLRQNGCMAYQGYLFGKPVPIEQFDDLMSALNTIIR